MTIPFDNVSRETYAVTMAPERRDAKVLGIRLSDSELKMVTDLVDMTGLSASDVMRQLLRREHMAVFGASKPKPPKPRKG